MLFRGKPLESIDESDLQSLIENGVAENKTIEYKSDLPKNSDNDKKEFLADVSSFANASGGHLIYGIRASKGIAKELTGLSTANIDSEKLRLEEIIRNGIAPRIPAIKLQEIKLHNSESAIIIEIPKSWTMPHMVVFQNHSRFFSRNSAGKYQLDITEIRSAFINSETFSERIRNFRMERISKIISGETPAYLNESPKTVLHIVPLNAFSSLASLDFMELEMNNKVVLGLGPIRAAGWDRRYNLDGFLTLDRDSYVQLFRNGSIEAVESTMFNPVEGKKLIGHKYFEHALIKYLRQYLDVLQMLHIELPIVLMLSLIGVLDYKMPNIFHFGNDRKIDRDILQLPEVLIEEYKCDTAKVMKPIFDSFWNAAGFSQSINYDEEGKWNPHS